jgi:hypothetical protein
MKKQSTETEISKPSDLDVCCGRGKIHMNHPGNQVFKRLVRANLRRYAGAPSNAEKSFIVSWIVGRLLSTGSRFIKKSDATGKWYDIGEAQAREKTGRAIRDITFKSKFILSDARNERTSKVNQFTPPMLPLTREDIFGLSMGLLGSADLLLKDKSPLRLLDENLSDLLTHDLFTEHNLEECSMPERPDAMETRCENIISLIPEDWL